MKKFLALMLVGILILSGCSSGAGSSGSSDKDANEITLWAWDPNFNIKAVELAKEAYKKENTDLNVKVIEYAQADVIQKLNTSLSSGSTKGLPNIVLIEDYRAQGFLKAYPDMFFELTDYMKSEDFASYKIAPTSLDGKNYGIPFDTGVGGLYVRTDYLEEAGYSIDDLVGMDWDKYIEIGKQVKAKTGKHMLTQDPKDLALIRMMIQSAGSWYMKEDGATPNIAKNEALKEAFLTYKKILDADIVKPVSDWSQFVAGFNSGDVASVPTGNWITPSVKAEASQSGKWTVANFPKLAGVPNSVNASNLGGSSWYVLNIDGKEKAAEFLGKTFGSNVDFYQTLVKEIGAIGTYIPASQSEAYQLSDEFFNGQAIVQDFAKWTEQIPQINYGLHTYAIDDILAIGMQDYIKGKDLDEVLNNAQKQAEEQIK